MADYQYIKELLSTGLGTEGSLLIPKKIYDTLIEESAKSLIPRSEAAIYIGPGDIPGSSIDINRVVENKMSVRVVGEGGEIPIDQTEYNNLNIKPLKYGVAIRITRELLEDAKWNLLQHNLMIAGKRFAENENALVIAALDTADNTVSGGASVTIANLTRAMQYLDDADKTPTSLAVGMEVLNDLRNIDTFVEANKVGNREMLERGFLGTVYGMQVYKVSTTAGMTTTTAYVYDRNYAYVIVEKRPMTVENFDLPVFDLSAASVTQRIAVSALRASAICKITSS
jgi:HK97 family phage major capsid protein